MIDRRQILKSAAALSLVGVVAPVAATESANYSAAAFEAAKGEGRPILIAIHASWCPTCRAQAPILSAIEKDPKYSKLLALRVDFDAQADVVRAFGARQQSTLIAFHGATETGRSVGDTNADSIAALVAHTL